MQQLPVGVVEKVGSKSGPRVAVFCGVHGNERAGILVVERLIKELEIDAGTVYFVFANQLAIERGVRFVELNLNRLFSRIGTPPDCYEARRAQELMDLLDTCDALLDLHSYRAPLLLERATPFAICEPLSLAIAESLPVPIVIQGFSAVQVGGTDGYLFSQRKVGICVELGALECPEAFVELGSETVHTFLHKMGCLRDGADTKSVQGQQHLSLRMMYRKTHESFRFLKPFRSFDTVSAGETIARENALDLIAEETSVIVFPSAEGPIGTEVFMLAVK